MPISTIDNFKINAKLAIDARMIATSSSSRNLIEYKYDGLKVFQIDNRVTYTWNQSTYTSTGITSSSWDIENANVGNGTPFHAPMWDNSGNRLTDTSISVSPINPITEQYTKVGIGGDPMEAFQVTGNYTADYLGGTESMPFVIHKGISTIIGENWYSNGGTNSTFNYLYGSSTIEFINGGFSFKGRTASSSSSVMTEYFSIDNQKTINVKPFWIKNGSYPSIGSIGPLNIGISPTNSTLPAITITPGGSNGIDGSYYFQYGYSQSKALVFQSVVEREDHFYFNSGQVSNYFTGTNIKYDSFELASRQIGLVSDRTNNTTFLLMSGSGGYSLLKPDNLTARRTLNLPNSSGIIPLTISVNGSTYSSSISGEINIGTVSTIQTLNTVTTNGSTTSNIIKVGGLMVSGTNSFTLSSTYSSFAGGNGYGGIIEATNPGSIAYGAVGSGKLSSSGNGAISFGAPNGGLISSMGAGSFAIGYTNTAKIVSSKDGSFAGGYSLSDPGIISATGYGSFAYGYVNYGKIESTQQGAISLGYISGGGNIISGGPGTLAFGAVQGGTINADSYGSFAGGYASAGQIKTGVGLGGGFAFGSAPNAASIIWAKSNGSIALGDAENGNIEARGPGSISGGHVVNSGSIYSGPNGGIGANFTWGYADGTSVTNTGRTSFAFGESIYSNGDRSSVMGTNMYSAYNYNYIFGRGITSSSNYQFIAGFLGTFSNNSIIQLDDANRWFSISANNTSIYESRFNTTNLSAHRLINLPNASGNLPMTVDGVTASSTGDIAISKYKVFTALVAQSSTNAPTINNVFQNTFTISPTFSYVSDGYYRIHCSDFNNTPSKIFVTSLKCTGGYANTIMINNQTATGNYLEIFSWNTQANALQDGLSTLFYLEVRIYN